MSGNKNNVANAVPQELPHLLESDRKPWVISDFQIESFEFLARGGFGQVYRITQRDQPDTVLKVQAAKNSSLKACLHMYDLAKNEAEIVGCLVHPNIIKLIKHKGYTNPFERRLAGYYTMQFELCQKSLYDFIKENQQSGKLYNRFISDNLLRQIGSAVKHMHQLRIAHHDIKPDNIMVVNEKVPRKALQFKLIDFGLAKKYFPGGSLESTQDNYYAGTGWYMSEDKLGCYSNQKGSNASYNPYLADVYALGVTLIECAMGFEAKIPNNRVYNSRMAAVQRMILKLSSVDHVSGLVRLALIRMLPLFEKHRSQMHEILK